MVHRRQYPQHRAESVPLQTLVEVNVPMIKPHQPANFLQLRESERTMASAIKNPHYMDIINPSLASNTVQNTLFGHLDGNTEAESLQMTCCKKGTKTECWCCGTQICAVRICTLIRTSSEIKAHSPSGLQIISRAARHISYLAFAVLRSALHPMLLPQDLHTTLSRNSFWKTRAMSL